ncbi:hypothetical protein [Streptomyces sp. 8N706]
MPLREANAPGSTSPATPTRSGVIMLGYAGARPPNTSTNWRHSLI